jgi:hypothetical protein
MKNTKTKLIELSIFDIDDTLFHTTAKVAVVKDGSVVCKLSNQEFNTYTLGVGETFDFSEFRNAKKFYDESTPMEPMMCIARQQLDRAKQFGKSKVIMVTARANFDVKEQFLDTFRKHHFDIDSVRVERAGNINNSESIARKKAIIIRQYLQQGTFNQVNFYDDALSNLNAFLSLQAEFPKIQFDAYLASTNGAKRVHLN